MMNITNVNCDLTATEHITKQTSSLKDWRGKVLAQLRNLILEAEPDITEEWKWGTAVWSKGGTICCAILYKNRIQLYFFHGASLDDPHGLFNAETDGMVSRAIDFRKGEAINEPALMELIRESVTFNLLGDLYENRAVEAEPSITLV
jgi:hypothetical protein